jgi:hypothetical protein
MAKVGFLTVIREMPRLRAIWLMFALAAPIKIDLADL